MNQILSCIIIFFTLEFVERTTRNETKRKVKANIPKTNIWVLVIVFLRQKRRRPLCNIMERLSFPIETFGMLSGDWFVIARLYIHTPDGYSDQNTAIIIYQKLIQ
jgi:hypothetical protein